MSLNKDQLISEKELVSSRLENALQAFHDEPSEDSFYQICDELVYAVIYNLNFYVPITASDGNALFSLQKYQGIGYAYQACTSEERLIQYAKKGGAIIPIRKLFERVEQDSLSGIVLNPSKENKALVFLNQENVRGILKVATDSIIAQPDDIRTFLQSEI